MGEDERNPPLEPVPILEQTPQKNRILIRTGKKNND